MNGWEQDMGAVHLAGLGPDYPAYTGSEPCTEIGLVWYFVPTRVSHETVLANACKRCDLYAECREWAVWHELHGYWAATTPVQRERERQSRGIEYALPIDNVAATEPPDEYEETA